MDKRSLPALIVLGLVLLALAVWLASYAKPAACRGAAWSIPALLNCAPSSPNREESRHG